MYFEHEEYDFFSPDLSHALGHHITICSNLDANPYALRSVPTHTEDGIPIRKLYVSNLPPKASRTEIFGVFAPYGFIKSCWLRIGEKGPNRTPTTTYAFVTYSSPGDAHKALQAPEHEKMLRGRQLRISPADSWHQPAVDDQGRVRWKPRGQRREDLMPIASCSHDSTSQGSSEQEAIQNVEAIVPTETVEPGPSAEPTYTILDILNRDCMDHIMSYIPINDLIRSERVSKGWQNMTQEYFTSLRTFKTSSWQHKGVTLTTAVLRRVLKRLDCLTRLHIDHNWSALNDRVAHTVGKFCPNLEELKVVGMHTKNWNPLIYGCKQLKSLSFVSCTKLTDTSLVHIIESDCKIQSLTVANNTHVTGFFLSGVTSSSLVSLAFYNCFSLQSTVLCSAIKGLPNLKSLKLDVCPENIWRVVPTMLQSLPNLQELSLSEFTSKSYTQGTQEFCDVLGTLKELRVLNLSRNVYITNAVLKQVAQTCTKLHTLNISSCCSKRNYFNTGVTEEGILAVTTACTALEVFDASYLAGLTDSGLMGLCKLPQLRHLTVRGNPDLTHVSLSAVLNSCPNLKEIDACGCDKVGAEVVSAAQSAVQRWPRVLALRLASTAVPTAAEDCETHKLLIVDTTDDRSHPNLRPDFFDRFFENISDDSLEDYFDPDDLDDFDGDDDEFLLQEQLDDYHHLIAYEIRAPNILLL